MFVLKRMCRDDSKSRYCIGISRYRGAFKPVTFQSEHCFDKRDGYLHYDTMAGVGDAKMMRRADSPDIFHTLRSKYTKIRGEQRNDV